MKCALVTGGSRGIGKAVCIALAEQGYHVLINYKSNEHEACDTLEKIRAKGGSGELIPFDVADKTSVDAALDAWMQNNQDCKIIVLVNNAGIKNDSLMIWMQERQWKNVIDISLNGFFHTTQKVLIPMLSNKFGRIINIVSVSGLKGLAGQTNYSAAKAGIIGATKSLALEVARKGVTVNAVAPGFIRTDMTKDIPEQELAKTIPVQRFGEAEEVAHLVAFLASDKASYITGEVISINGGLL
ncbi:MAG: 3-oxoacyl-ACP reductase FabG [Prevotellaceae bacterium]|jgi:3-oxoacyl-[acyl-carrier protein] reductase|nr:3-oxoacyl-ACP reductase FabG [Prevotellaceae bacterium]